MYRRAVLSGLLAIVGSLPIQAERGIAVAGSFRQFDNAVSAQQALQPNFDVQLQVAETEVNSHRWYRVQAVSDDARGLVTKMRLAGIDGAFFQPATRASTPACLDGPRLLLGAAAAGRRAVVRLHLHLHPSERHAERA